MSKDNVSGNDNSNDESASSNNLSGTPSSTASAVLAAKRAAKRSKPYDANNSFVRKVTSKVTDLIPQNSWISKWFNSSQNTQVLESEPENTQAENSKYDDYEVTQFQPPLKRARIRMDVTHPPGTFFIKEPFARCNDTTQDFLEPTTSRHLDKLPRFVSSTPAIPVDKSKLPESRSALNLLMRESNNCATNGTDDNSESSESTSGCSSLIPQTSKQDGPSSVTFNSPFRKRRHTDEKFSFKNFVQSPRSLLLDNTLRDTLANRRPSFNPSLVNNSTLERSSSLSSPFYSGNTMFGGSNAANLYRSNSVLSEPSQLRPPPRTSVEVNPAPNETSKSDFSGMSTTARRILETIEQFSSPLTDARKIPVRDVMGGSQNTSSNSNTSSILNMTRKRQREENSPRVGLRHLTRDLIVPTVPDMMRLRRRQRLQNTTMNARKIATARSGAVSSSVPQKYHIRSQADVELKRSSNQLKAKKNIEEEETVEAVNLPAIPLPISNLACFDIPLPVPPKLVVQEKQQTPKASKDDFFEFANPIKLPGEIKNLESVNNFKFSKPISPSKTSSPLNEPIELSKTLSIDSNDSASGSFPNFVWNGPSQPTLKPKEKNKTKEEEQLKGLKVASELKTGSVMDFFAKSSSMSTTNTDTSDVWECNECLIKNSSKVTYCVACKSSKSKNSGDDVICLDSDSNDHEIVEIDHKLLKTSTKIFGNSINPNPNSDTFGKHDSIKPESSEISTLSSTALSVKSTTDTTVKASDTSNMLTLTTSVNKSSTLDAFKSTKSCWECPCCMVQNTETITTCPCCNTAKPGSVKMSPKRTLENTLSTSSTTFTSGFGDKFKKPEGSWTCDTCMIQNKSDVVKCVACETPKPSAAKTSSSSSLSSSSEVFTTANSFGDKFKKPEGSWTCDTCMITNNADTVKCAACETPKIGAATQAPKATSIPKTQFQTNIPAKASSFKFGIDKANEDSTKSHSSTSGSLPNTNGFTFGNNTSSSTATATSFSFGIQKEDDKEKFANSDSAKSIADGFTFKSNSKSTASEATFKFGVNSVENKDSEENKPETATFSFRQSTNTDVKPSTGVFVFGSPISADKSNEDKKDELKPAVTALFTFGTSAVTTTQANKDLVTDNKSKTASESPATDSFVFGSFKPTFNFQSKVEETPKADVPETETAKTVDTSSEPQKTTTSTGFSFGNPSTARSPSLFTFRAQSNTSETPTPATTAALPTFGSSNAPKSMFSFGKSTETISATTSAAPNKDEKTIFNSFGTPTPSAPAGSSTFGQSNQASTSLFSNVNAVASPTPSTETKSLFGAPENKTAPIFGQSDVKIPTFGQSDVKIPTFGSSSTENKQTVGSSLFGAPATTTSSATIASPFGSGTNIFGSSQTSTFGSNTNSSIFSTTKASETITPTPGLFTFGQSSQTPAPATSGFNFNAGSNATVTNNNNEQKSLFTFGSYSSNAVGNGFGGSSTSSGTGAATANFTFNAPKPDTSILFGASGTTTPMFNAPGTTPSAQIPTFGAGTSSAPTTGGFNFGSSSVPNNFSFGSSSAPPSGGFNLSAPGSTAPPAFDPNATPTFNFTAGSGAPTAFNAPPSRKIKRAVRRMPR